MASVATIYNSFIYFPHGFLVNCSCTLNAWIFFERLLFAGALLLFPRRGKFANNLTMERTKLNGCENDFMRKISNLFQFRARNFVWTLPLTDGGISCLGLLKTIWYSARRKFLKLRLLSEAQQYNMNSLTLQRTKSIFSAVKFCLTRNCFAFFSPLELHINNSRKH